MYIGMVAGTFTFGIVLLAAAAYVLCVCVVCSSSGVMALAVPD
jgi:hypothetical protein